MASLQSLSKPMSSGMEAAAEAAPARKVLKGAGGSGGEERSRAVERFVVVGKGEPIERASSGLPFGAESVIGIDTRERILETDLAPWRMICALRMFADGGGSAIGTGWLAGPRTIVTAGHCVHHMGFFSGWADTIEISPGRDGSELPFKTVTAKRFSSVDRWVNDADPDFDIGCIHLDEDLGSSIGWFSIGSLQPKELDSHMVNISGYPGDRGGGTEQYFHKNRILHVGARRIFYDVDTAGGQSGVPVWIHEKQGDPPLVVGIHARGIG